MYLTRRAFVRDPSTGACLRFCMISRCVCFRLSRLLETMPFTKCTSGMLPGCIVLVSF